MSGLVDGLYSHVDGSEPKVVAKRLLEGRLNPRLDDPFGLTFEEMDAKIARLRKRKADAELRATIVKNELARAETERQQLLEAKERFYETGEVDPALLPDCSDIHTADKSAYDSETLDAAEQSLTESVDANGWEIDRRRADDEFVYITIKRRRAEFEVDRIEQRPVRERLVERIRSVVEAHRDAIREFSIHRSPIKPGAP